MFFAVSKVFWLLVQPISLVLLLILAAIALVAFHRRRLAIGALSVAALIVGFGAFTSLGYVLIQPLEDRFALPQAEPASVRAIVMLGGATKARPSTARQTVALNDAGERLTTTLWLARRYPEASIVLSGGGGLLAGDTESEAETARRFFLSMGIADERLVLEGESRNTIENAEFTRALIGSGTGETVLVTSAFHMPRSVGLFRAQGVDVIPWPTDYRSTGSQTLWLDVADPNGNFDTAATAMREWIGLAVYRLTGQIEDLFPAP
ncbi:YdcF family protein [Devosia sediminis]|uniref:YdcF family protein n=1 Tax=Devosia sediminis TaxID=2798801 RepID=A0A934MJN3_9HYPH|nr:YdcF family protein [Devosia sediminis]MBJ3783255.1 YdcF family protein [Devosia sediminis]